MLIEKQQSSAATLPWAHFRLRPFPQIAIRVMQLANREDVPLHKLSGLISSDPAFSSEVLTIANSPLFAPRTPAVSILQAVARLGTRNIQGLCLAVAVRAYLGASISLPSMRALWRHNMACAVIAEKISALGSPDKDIAFTAGIMHDIGRLALAAIQPHQYSVLLCSHRGTAHSILASERELFGVDHCEAGRLLIADWRLPAAFEPIVADHHAFLLTGESWSMAAQINLACRMADAAGFAAFEGCEVEPFARLLGELPAPDRSRFSTDAETLASEVAARIDSVGSA
jgi:HD-like signal output (HDOD) protein